MGFTTALRVDFVDGEDRLILTQPLYYYDPETGLEIIVPIGFYSDGASIPRLLWTLVGHPFNRHVREAAVLHDYLYYSGKVSRADADRIFRQAMKWLEAPWYKRYAYWSGVRVGAGMVWAKYRRETADPTEA